MSLRARLAAGGVILATCVATLPVFRLLWHREVFDDLNRQPGGWVAVAVIVVSSAIVHEALHVVGWRWAGRVAWRSISLRPTWTVMGLRAALDARIPTRASRIALLLPALALAAPALGIGLACGHGLLVLWGQFFLLECFSDFAAIFEMREITHVVAARQN